MRLTDPWSVSNSMDTRRTFYLSGPMQGYHEFNFPAFTKAAQELRDAGLTIVSPNELKLPEGTVATGEGLEFLANDFAVMAAKCQGIILLRGWPASKGARAELEIALTLKWPVYYYDDYTLVSMNAQGVI